ncbi:hypothetical protein ACFL1H_00525 [Nanoarchaeota archaeon]
MGVKKELIVVVILLVFTLLSGCEYLDNKVNNSNDPNSSEINNNSNSIELDNPIQDNNITEELVIQDIPQIQYHLRDDKMLTLTIDSDKGMDNKLYVMKRVRNRNIEDIIIKQFPVDLLQMTITNICQPIGERTVGFNEKCDGSTKIMTINIIDDENIKRTSDNKKLGWKEGTYDLIGSKLTSENIEGWNSTYKKLGEFTIR